MEALLLIERSVKEALEKELNRVGIMYRLFSRIKDKSSIEEKINRKNYSSDKTMTDVVGFRITTYFNDDVNILSDYFKKSLDFYDDNYDELKPNIFEPTRKNLTCRMSAEHSKMLEELKRSDPSFSFVNNTYEIQFRTTLSEGWHEVEHNMRYKCKDEWENRSYENRIFNGIYAALESLDHSMKSIFDDLSYSHYRNKNWNGMIRNLFRLKFQPKPIRQEIIEILNDDNGIISRRLFKIDRNYILKLIINSELRMQFTMDNVVYLINYLVFNDDRITALCPKTLNDDFHYYLPAFYAKNVKEKKVYYKTYNEK